MSLSIPNTCRTDTFISGRPGISSAGTTVIGPPCLGTNRDPNRFDGSGRNSGGNLAELRAAAIPAASGSPGSSKADRFQILVGLDDLAQPLLRGTIAAIRVGVMALHQQLETDLDFGSGGF